MVNPIRFGGIASGLDTESLVKQLVSAEKTRVDKFTQQKIWKQWQQTAYNETNKTMANFILDTRKNLGLTRTTSTGSLVSGSINTVDWVKKASSTSTAFDVKATASAPSGVSTLEVLNLAKGANASSLSDVDPNQTAESIIGTANFNVDGNATIKINDKDIILSKTDSLSLIAQKIRAAVPELNANYDLGSKRFFMSTKSTGEPAVIAFGNDDNTKKMVDALKLPSSIGVASQGNIEATKTAGDLLGFAAGSKTITIDGNSIELDFDDTLDEVATKINDTAGLGLNASYNPINKMFMITGNSSISFGADSDSQSFVTGFKLTNSLSSKGENASIKYNGGAAIEYTSNNISINGLSLTLKAETNGIQTVSVDTDVDGAYNKIKEFVDEYNKLIDGFDLKLAEKKYRDFQPLTDEQKEAMSENDIKLWEEKAKSGLLKNDETMTRMMQTIRQDIYQKVDGFGSIYELGITTGSWRDNGKLTIDETKLKDALRNDSEKVLNTLFKTSDTPEVTITSADTGQALVDKQALIAKRKSESGAFIRIFDGLTSGIKEIVDKSGPGSEASLLRSVKSNILIEYVTSGSRSLIDKDVSEIDKRISRETERLASLEERYWKQFTALEKAMSQMNSQSSWLSQQFGGGQ